jgi:hypothetical protein
VASAVSDPPTPKIGLRIIMAPVSRAGEG